MYLLARYITGRPLGALIAGFAFTFSPFHLSVAMQYNALGSIQWIPLYMLALLVLLRRGRLRDAALTAQLSRCAPSPRTTTLGLSAGSL